MLNGNYIVCLHFSKVYLKGQFVGAHVFNVSLEGEVVFPFVNIFTEAGGFHALIKEATTTVADGNLMIEFTHIVQNPKINTIEICPIYIPSVLLNCGGPSVVNNEGNLWSSDMFSGYNNAGIPNLISKSITQTTNKVLYQPKQWLPASKQLDELKYDIPILNGKYDVYLHFTETYGQAQAEGAREFDVYIEGELVFPKVNIYKEVGGYTTLIKTSQGRAVNDGILMIELKKVTQNPKICAVEIHPKG